MPCLSVVEWWNQQNSTTLRSFAAISQLSDFSVHIAKTSSSWDAAEASACCGSSGEKKRVQRVPRPVERNKANLEVLRKAAAWRGEQEGAKRGGMALI